MAVGLDAIVLDKREDWMGWGGDGEVAVCAWERKLWWLDADPEFIAEHRGLLDLLGVERTEVGDRLEARWTEAQARAFQLLHILRWVTTTTASPRAVAASLPAERVRRDLRESPARGRLARRLEAFAV